MFSGQEGCIWESIKAS